MFYFVLWLLPALLSVSCDDKPLEYCNLFSDCLVVQDKCVSDVCYGSGYMDQEAGCGAGCKKLESLVESNKSYCINRNRNFDKCNEIWSETSDWQQALCDVSGCGGTFEVGWEESRVTVCATHSVPCPPVEYCIYFPYCRIDGGSCVVDECYEVVGNNKECSDGCKKQGSLKLLTESFCINASRTFDVCNEIWAKTDDWKKNPTYSSSLCRDAAECSSSFEIQYNNGGNSFDIAFCSSLPSPPLRVEVIPVEYCNHFIFTHVDGNKCVNDKCYIDYIDNNVDCAAGCRKQVSLGNPTKSYCIDDSRTIDVCNEIWDKTGNWKVSETRCNDASECSSTFEVGWDDDGEEVKVIFCSANYASHVLPSFVALFMLFILYLFV